MVRSAMVIILLKLVRAGSTWRAMGLLAFGFQGGIGKEEAGTLILVARHPERCWVHYS